MAPFERSIGGKPPGSSFKPPPAFQALPKLLQERLVTTHRDLDGGIEALFAIPNAPVHWVEPVASALLTHRLSDAFVQKQMSEGRDLIKVAQAQLHDTTRLTAEVSACEGVRDMIGQFVAKRNHAKFGQLLVTACTIAVGKKTSIRSGGVQLGVDASGIRWGFPSHNDIDGLLSRLATDVLEGYSRSPLFAAIISLVGVNAIHPFMDGNGRTSRAVFNALLRESGVLPGLSFIPLKHIYFLSKFGFELRLREALLLGNYVPIITYFCDVMDLLGELGDPTAQSSQRLVLRGTQCASALGVLK